MPFNRCNLGSEQGLIDDPVLGQGRDPLAPLQDVITDEGDIVVPVDSRYLGLWLTGLFGDPNTTDNLNGSWTPPFTASEMGRGPERGAGWRAREGRRGPQQVVAEPGRRRTAEGLGPERSQLALGERLQGGDLAADLGRSGLRLRLPEALVVDGHDPFSRLVGGVGRRAGCAMVGAGAVLALVAGEREALVPKAGFMTMPARAWGCGPIDRPAKSCDDVPVGALRHQTRSRAPAV